MLTPPKDTMFAWMIRLRLNYFQPCVSYLCHFLQFKNFLNFSSLILYFCRAINFSFVYFIGVDKPGMLTRGKC